MSRVKTFDATGIATGGVLYAGDLNNIQDHYADLSNFAQTVDVSSLRVGDTSIQLLKFGTAEARVSAALRTDGILRGLGGLYSGQFTTAGRPGAGSRPYGLMIFNTDLSRYEVNVGTDAAPSWVPLLVSADVLTLPLGGMIDYAGSADLSSSMILADGRELSRATYSALFALISTTYGAGNGTTTFNIPDLRGRVSVGPDNMGTAQGAANRIPNSSRTLGQSSGEERHVITTAEMAAHSHGGSTGTDTPDHSHSGTTDAQGAHSHTGSHDIQTVQFGSGTTVGGWGKAIGGSGAFNTGFSIDAVGSHQHNITTGGASARHSHSITTEGSGTGHNTMQPYQVMNKLIRVL